MSAIDPATLTYCPCGRRVEEPNFVCKPCWVSAPDYFRIKFSQGNTQFKREQARNQIMNHARRRAR